MTQPTILTVTTRPPQVCVGALGIKSAPTVSETYAVLGQPSRIESGEPPAPAGHRNNQIHVFDDLGLTFNEHHFTQRVQGITCWFDTDEPPFRFTPKCTFEGRLIFESVTMPLGGKVREFLTASPYAFADQFAGTWHHQFDGFSIFVNSRGHRLPSGGRSKVRQVMYVSLSWPHDNWQKPASSTV